MTLHPHQMVIPIVAAKELADQLIGHTYYCAWFRIDSLGDGTYEMTVSQGAGDGNLNALEHGTRWDDSDG